MSLQLIITINLQKSREGKEILEKVEKRQNRGSANRVSVPLSRRGCEKAPGGVQSGRMGLCSVQAVRTRLAASYAADAAGPLTSELQQRARDTVLT